MAGRPISEMTPAEYRRSHSIGVDPDCVELARKFLAAAYTAEAPSEKRVAAELQSLSEAIQIAIEDWFFAHPETDDADEPAKGRVA